MIGRMVWWNPPPRQVNMAGGRGIALTSSATIAILGGCSTKTRNPGFSIKGKYATRAPRSHGAGPMYAGQLFSEHFLTDGIRTTAAYQRLTTDPTFSPGVRRRLEEVYQQFPFQAEPDEAQTEQDLIFRVLEVVGWNRDIWIVQPRAARKGRSDVPRHAAIARCGRKAKGERRAREGPALSAWRRGRREQRWDRPLDRSTQGARKGDEEREVPSSQILRYLSRAETLSDRRIQWAILTNGRLWRLYYQGAKSRLEEYLEIDLSRLWTFQTCRTC